MNANLTLMVDKQAPITPEEADANFRALVANVSTPATLAPLPVNIYISGDLLTFQITNYNPNAIYLVNSVAGIGTITNGEFSIYPIGDGVNVFIIEENKLPNATLVPVTEQYLVVGKSVTPNTFSGATRQGALLICNDDGLVATATYTTNVADYNVKGMRVHLYVTIEKHAGFDASLSNVNEMFFRQGIAIPSKITAYSSATVKEIYSTTGYELGDFITTKDILGDGSCIELWSFNDTLNNFEGTNLFAPVAAAAPVYSFVAGRLDNCLYNSSATTGAFDAFQTPNAFAIVGDNPVTITFWIRSINTLGTWQDGISFGIGGYGQRYNLEITYRALNGFVSLVVFGHKRGWTINPGSKQLSGWNFVSYTYSPTNRSNVYLNLELHGSDATQMKWLANPYTLGYFQDTTANKYNQLCQARVFNKELTLAELAKVQKEGYSRLPLSPPLSAAPTKMLCGEMPTATFNGVSAPVTDALISDDGTLVNLKRTVGDTPYTDIYDAPNISISCNNSDNGYNTEITTEVDVTLNKN